MKIISTFAALLAGGTLLIANPVIPSDYPLKHCPISGEPLGSGGMIPYKLTHKGTDVWLCCKMCKKRFDQNPDVHTDKVRDAKKD